MKGRARKKMLLCKLEETEGVEAGTAGEDLIAIYTRDLEVTPIAGETITLNEDTGTMGSDEEAMVGQMMDVTFKFRLSGSGAAGTAPASAPIILACGHTETVTSGVKVDYLPDDEGTNTVTIYAWRHNMYHKYLGARGSLKVVDQAKAFGYFEAKMQAKYLGPVSGTLPTPTYTAQASPVPFRTSTVSFSLHSVVAGLHGVTFDFGQKLAQYEHSEEETPQIEDRAARYEAHIEEQQTLSTQNVTAICAAATSGAISLVHGTTAGNIVEISAPSAQISTVKPDKVVGINSMQLTGPLRKNAAGDYKITFR